MPQAEPEPAAEAVQVDESEQFANVYPMDAFRLEKPTLADDGMLHPRGKDIVFAGSPRGPVAPPAERTKPSKDELMGLLGAQLAGAAAVTLLAWWIAIQAILHPSGGWNGAEIGGGIGFGILIPVAIIVLRSHGGRTSFWWHWCASRGFEPGAADGPGKVVPGLLDRSPLIGGLSGRHFEHVAVRKLAGEREAVVGSLLRLAALGADAEYGDLPEPWRIGVVIMPMPEQAANRWKGASIRADHYARRPIVMRAMLGGLIAPGFAECRAHIAAEPEQDQRALQALVDPRMNAYLADHPMDVDIVGDLLVVTRDGAPDDAETLDDLCRDALLLHELLVPAHELARPTEHSSVAMPRDDEPVVDLTREGWGGGDDVQYYEAA